MTFTLFNIILTSILHYDHQDPPCFVSWSLEASLFDCKRENLSVTHAGVALLYQH